ncbi:hypothetical protein MTO96_007990 [Rhipicephalus appendiculatus]
MEDDVPQEAAFHLPTSAHCVLMDLCSNLCNDSRNEQDLGSFVYDIQPLLHKLPWSNILHNSIGSLCLVVCRHSGK